MFRILTFLEMLPVWRSRRIEAKKYRAAGGHFELGAARVPLRPNQTFSGAAGAEALPDTLPDMEDADARQALSWLGLGQNFSAVDMAAGGDPDVGCHPAECN
ncbi:hypothetical protein G6M78_27510 [Agrobacterium tumefaciens]|uniref:hypothetical protein n=1 Tax=Agrobacterium tumefaciens TaxID=358 RepID=UPI001573701F|nr:hypothetical protein [Agrobacterium tumefaciens]NTE58834.1 hypothetical protein [Agrobacterium tumefaciens]NTE72432.1 hypothetical protein [Agrobacterium tumefaciens]